MSSMIFIDSNIPMYLIGVEHPLRSKAEILLTKLIRSKRRLVTSAEVLQEICHRYCAIGRKEFLQPAFDTVYGLVDQVFPVTPEDVNQAKVLLLGYQNISARDALHAAMMRNLGIKEIFTFDSDFDRFSWITRVS